MRGGEPKPLSTDIVHVGEDGGNGTSTGSVGHRAAPGARGEMLKDELVQLVVDGIGFEEDLQEILIRCGQSAGHANPPFAGQTNAIWR